MKRSAFSISFWLVAVLLFSTFTAVSSDAKPTSGIVSGKVLDAATGEELTGVCIKVAGTDLVTYTEADGSFKIDINEIKSVEGQLELQLTLVSFESKTLVLSKDDSDVPAIVSLQEK